MVDLYVPPEVQAWLDHLAICSHCNIGRRIHNFCAVGARLYQPALRAMSRVRVA